MATLRTPAMAKIAIIVLADSESHADGGRLANALTLAQEAQVHGDDVTVLFDGAGTTWIPKLEDDDHDMAALYRAVEDVVEGACAFCAGAFGVGDAVEESDVASLSEYEGHPSVRSLIDDGYEVVTF